VRLGNIRLDLFQTLIDSAQCFSWRQEGENFVGCAGGRPLLLRYEGEELCAFGAQEEFFCEYLDLNRDYNALQAEFSPWPKISQAMALYPDIHVLNQDPWETLISFILSANNNVARIRKLVNAICENFGPKGEIEGFSVFGFPSPDRLAACGQEELRALGVGYRAPYLVNTARMVADGFALRELKKMPYEAAQEMLMRLPGVGAKVADCVLLFGCRHAEAFPVDVWVERLMKNWFGAQAPSRQKLSGFARKTFGMHAGLAQQYLFHAARTGGIQLFEEEV